MIRIRARRSGAALILALLAIVVLDCIILGTLHLALQENRIANNRSSVLQLRLDADGGARRALAFWSEQLDTLPPGAAHRVQVPAAITPGAVVHVERLDQHLYMIESVAAEPAPRAGRATSRLLLTPPALPPDAEPAAAAVTAAVSVHVAASGSVDAISPTACGLPAGNSIMAPPFAITTDP